MVILEDTGVYRLAAKLWLTLLHFLNLFEDYFILHAHKGVQVRFRAQLTGVSRFFHQWVLGWNSGAMGRCQARAAAPSDVFCCFCVLLSHCKVDRALLIH